MKEFNLEIAKQKHPLCYRNGDKVVDFFMPKFTENYSHPVYSWTEDGNVIPHTLTGKYRVGGLESNRDLFLDDSVEWERKPEYGEEILVRNKNEDNNWQKRYFLRFLRNGKVLCVTVGTSKNFIEETGEYSTIAWNEWKFLDTLKKSDIEKRIEELEEELRKLKYQLKP